MYLPKNISKSKFSVQAQNIDLVVAFSVHPNLFVTDNYYSIFFWHVSLASVAGLFSSTSLTCSCKLMTIYRLKSPTMLFAQRTIPNFDLRDFWPCLLNCPESDNQSKATMTRRRRGWHLVKNEFVIYQPHTQLTRSVQYASVQFKKQIIYIYWTGLGKISWFVSGEQINSAQLFPKTEGW